MFAVQNPASNATLLTGAFVKYIQPCTIRLMSFRDAQEVTSASDQSINLDRLRLQPVSNQSSYKPVPSRGQRTTHALVLLTIEIYPVQCVQRLHHRSEITDRKINYIAADVGVRLHSRYKANNCVIHLHSVVRILLLSLFTLITVGRPQDA
jgi:hypothetical protein